jgi:NADPH:quinone reductase-like Zn-dependent oxidoreductase
MKKWVIEPGKKGIEALCLKEMIPPEPKSCEVLVRMHATSINYRDLINLNQGVAQELIPFSDGAGVVEEVGKEVSHLKKGDRVVGLFFPIWQSGDLDAEKFSVARGGVPTDGVLAQYVCGQESSFLKIPDYLSLEEASTLPCAGVTAWHALVVKGKLKPGESIVIMGTGGVAIFALQIAKKIGARVFLLSSSDEKLGKGKKMGADELINYKKTPNWEERVLELTSQVGADLIIDLGGGGTLAKSIAAVKMSGRISLVGVLTGFTTQINPLPILRRSLSVNGIYVGSGDMQKQLQRALELNGIHPVIDRVFKFGQAKEACEYLLSAQHFGKIVIAFN